MSFDKIPNKPYTARDLVSIVEDAREYIRRKYPDDVNSFFPGDVPTMLLEMVAYIFDNLSFAVDRTGEEAFLATARLRSSALRHARSVSYPVRTIRAATVDLVPPSFEPIRAANLSSATSTTKIQRLTLDPAPTGGTYTLSYNGQTTPPIPFDASAPTVQNAVQLLSTVGAGNMLVSGSGTVADPFVFRFAGVLGFVEGLPNVTISPSLTRNHVYSLSVAATGGTYTLTVGTLTVGGQTTSPISYNADAAAVDAALGALSSIGGAANVTVTGTPTLFTIAIGGTLQNQNTGPLTVDTASLTGGTATAATVTTGGTPVANPAAAFPQTTAASVAAYTAFFAKGTRLVVGDQTWEVAEDTTVNGLTVNDGNFQTQFRVPFSEGLSGGELFTADGSAGLRIVTRTASIIEGSVEVRVGAPSSYAWVRVDAINTADATAPVYTLEYDSEGRAVLTFGDGTNGLVPANGAGVYVFYRSGKGAAGNLSPGSIAGGVACRLTDKNGIATTSSVQLVNVEASAGGRDGETLDEIRRNLPAWLRTVDKAITREDIETLAVQSPITSGSISRAGAYLASATVMPLTSGQSPSPSSPITVPSGSLVRIGNDYTFSTSRDLVIDEPDPVLFVNPNLVHLYLWSPSLRGHVPATATARQQVLEYLTPRLLLTVTLRPLPGRNRTINIDLGTVFYDVTVPPDTVRQRVADAVAALFTSDYAQPGKSFRLSDLYHAVEMADGVDHFEIVTPTGDVELGKDEMPLLGALTYTLQPVPPPTDPDLARAALNDRLFN